MKTIKNIILVIIILASGIGLFIILDYGFRVPSIDYENIAGMYAEEKNTLDMVYIGGSASFVYYEPLRAYENYGIASYDYGANTIQLELYKYMIKELLEYQNPEVIVIDARAFQYRENDQPPTAVAYRNVLDGMKFSENRYEFIENYVEKTLQTDTLPFHFSLMLYHTRTNGFSIERAKNLLLDNTSNDLKGFYFVPKAARVKKEKNSTKEKTAVAQETEDILIDLLDYLDTIDKKVLFIVSPYVETVEEKKMFNYVEEIIENRGYDFLDTNEKVKEMGIDYDKDFYNYNHVNIFGADKYTDYLADYLIENYELADRREEEKYKSWNDLLPEWNQKVKETKEQTENIIKGKYYNDTIDIKTN